MSEEQVAQVNETVMPVAQEEIRTPQERTFKQSEVNEIVGRVRKEAAQKASERVAQEYTPSAQSGLTEQQARKYAAEEIQRSRDEWQKEYQTKTEAETAQKIVNNFWSKIESGKSKFEDFDQVAGDIELARFPNVVEMLAEHIDNSAEVLYEFGKNRSKLAQLEQLAQMSPRDAIKEAKRLSQSIKDNEPTANTRHANEPLSKTRSSNSGTESGPLSMADLKRKYRA